MGQVLLSADAHALVRPGSTPSGLRQAASPSATAEHGYQEGLQRGLAQGLKDGLIQGRDQGLEKGYGEGHLRGLAEGRAEAARELQQRLQELEVRDDQRAARITAIAATFTSQLGEQLATQLREAEDDMVALTHAAVCRLLGEHALQPEQVVSAVQRAVMQHLAQGPFDASRLTSVHVHPDDLKMLTGSSALQDWLAEQGEHGVRWQADAEVRTGGCIVHGEMDRLDARLDTQLEALRQEFARFRAAARVADPELSR